MSEDKSVVSDNVDQPPVVSDQENQSTQTEDKVAYDTYKKAVGEAKRAKEQTRILEAELQKKQNAELELKGKDKELIESLRKQVETSQGQVEKIKQDFAFQIYTKEVKSELIKAGALDDELLIGAIDIKAIGINDDFTFNQDDIKREVQNLVNKKPQLFRKKVVDVKDGIPKVNVTNGAMDLSKMTLSEKMARVAELSAKGAYQKK